ncbi:MAG TPA: hypothetical protein VFP87_09345 [Chitinophagaceae bacterium]|nr:hypothetical protein [Chitinophagaceae bacterium]
MKRMFYIGLIMLRFYSTSNAQGTSNSLAPEFLNQPFFVDAVNNRLVNLERQTMITKYRLKGMFVEFKGLKSPVRIGKADTVTFIIRVNSGTDPRDSFELVTLNEKKDKREAQILGGGLSQQKYVYKKIPYGLRKVDKGVYLLLVPSLSSGEYYFGSYGKTFAFGVDLDKEIKKEP